MARKKHRAMGTLMKYLGLIIFFYALYCVLLFVQQRRIMFPRHLIPEPRPVELEQGEQLWLETGFGRVEAWFFPPRGCDGPCPAVMFAHGNAELIDYYPRELHWLQEQGMGLLLVEYPGYGRSAGSPSRGSLRTTFIAAYDRLAARPDVDPDRIVLFGRSIGAAVIADLARARPARAMVMVAPFASVRALARKFLAPPFLILDRFDNLEAVRNYPNPVLVLHGRNDSVIPLNHGRAVAEAAPHGRLETYDCDHNDCPPSWEELFEDVRALLERSGVLSKPSD